MIYIPGKQFQVGKQEQMDSKSVTARLNHMQVSDKRRQQITAGPLVPGRQYTVMNILHKHPEGILVYAFKEGGTNRRLEMEFKSSQEADEFIARVGGELKTLKKIRQSIAETSGSGL